MSGPFAERDDYGCILIEGMQCVATGLRGRDALQVINTAVLARERAAAAKALRSLADFAAQKMEHLPPSDALRHPAAEAALGYVEREARTRADAIERGEQ